MLGILNNLEIEEVLNQQVIGRIGCHADGVTYIVPVSYVYRDNEIFCLSKDGMKIDLMRKNPKVCFEVEAFTNMANWRTVISWGTFKEIIDEEARANVLKMLLSRPMPLIASEMVQLTPEWPFTPDSINGIEGVVYKIELQEKTGRYEDQKDLKHLAESYL